MQSMSQKKAYHHGSLEDFLKPRSSQFFISRISTKKYAADYPHFSKDMFKRKRKSFPLKFRQLKCFEYPVSNADMNLQETTIESIKNQNDQSQFLDSHLQITRKIHTIHEELVFKKALKPASKTRDNQKKQAALTFAIRKLKELNFEKKAKKDEDEVTEMLRTTHIQDIEMS